MIFRDTQEAIVDEDTWYVVHFLPIYCVAYESIAQYHVK